MEYIISYLIVLTLLELFCYNYFHKGFSDLMKLLCSQIFYFIVSDISIKSYSLEEYKIVFIPDKQMLKGVIFE